ncbi:hypothetical protein C8Q77DRAFT_764009 [Trametes polyzona]|nr:hypothetical protein C8Q77DRAFT_764009 [Trametes polyzona]
MFTTGGYAMRSHWHSETAWVLYSLGAAQLALHFTPPSHFLVPVSQQSFDPSPASHHSWRTTAHAMTISMCLTSGTLSPVSFCLCRLSGIAVLAPTCHVMPTFYFGLASIKSASRSLTSPTLILTGDCGHHAASLVLHLAGKRQRCARAAIFVQTFHRRKGFKRLPCAKGANRAQQALYNLLHGRRCLISIKGGTPSLRQDPTSKPTL